MTASTFYLKNLETIWEIDDEQFEEASQMSSNTEHLKKEQDKAENVINMEVSLLYLGKLFKN